MNILVYLWTSRWRSRFDVFAVQSLLAVDCGAFGIILKPLNILHGFAGYGVFGGFPSEAGVIKGC